MTPSRKIYSLMRDWDDIAKGGTRTLPRLTRQRRRIIPKEFRNYDARRDGIYCLVAWSHTRPLTPESLSTAYVALPNRPHRFDEPEWRSLAAASAAAGDAGRTCYVTSLGVDHGEH